MRREDGQPIRQASKPFVAGPQKGAGRQPRRSDEVSVHIVDAQPWIAWASIMSLSSRWLALSA
jgi:hypothetical protein